jgi:hypothetical protein
MSHFTTVKVNCTDSAILKEALIECGIQPAHVEVHEEPVYLRSYTGEKLKTKAHVVVRRENIGRSAADMGWLLGEHGEAHVDGYCNKYAPNADQFIGKVAQHYGVITVEKKARSRGKTPIRVTDQKTGDIKVFVNA